MQGDKFWSRRNYEANEESLRETERDRERERENKESLQIIKVNIKLINCECYLPE